MLMLRRLKNQDIVIKCPDGTRIVIRNCGVTSGGVRMGIEAPIAYQVFRGELLEKRDGK